MPLFFPCYSLPFPCYCKFSSLIFESIKSQKRPYFTALLVVGTLGRPILSRFSLYYSLLAGKLGGATRAGALRRQPASPGSGDFQRGVAIEPAVSGDLATGQESLDNEFDAFRACRP